MVEHVDYEDILEKSRKGLPKEELTKYMPALVDLENDFENPTKLRLLGNAIANSMENAGYLIRAKGAVERLMSLKPLGWQILYNGCVENPDFSRKLLGMPEFLAEIEPTVFGRRLTGAIFENLEGDVPMDDLAMLAVKGYVELILVFPQLQQHPQVLQRFDKVYEKCQNITTADAEGSLTDTDTYSLGFEVVESISSHKEFGVQQAISVSTERFTWDTVALLANLTAERANLESVLAKWPNVVSSTMELIREEDPDEDRNEGANGLNGGADDSAAKKTDDDLGEESSEPSKSEDDSSDAGQQETADSKEHEAHAGEDEHGASGDDEHPQFEYDDSDDGGAEAEDQRQMIPFDLRLWGPLLRNIARHPRAAEQIAAHRPGELVSRLLESPMMQDVAWDFATTFSANKYDHDLTALVTEPPYSGGTVLVASSMVEGFLSTSGIHLDEADWAAPRLVASIVGGLVQSENPLPVWVKGTRALAMLQRAFPRTSVDPAELKSRAPNSDAVAANIRSLSV